MMNFALARLYHEINNPVVAVWEPPDENKHFSETSEKIKQ